MKRLLQTISATTLLALIVAFTFTASQAQSSANNQRSTRQKGEMLLGKVINARTGQAIANAIVTVKLTGSSARENATVRTNRNGFFVVTGIAKGNHVIRVTQDGYQLWKNKVYVPLVNRSNTGPFSGFSCPAKATTVGCTVYSILTTKAPTIHPICLLKACLSLLGCRRCNNGSQNLLNSFFYRKLLC